MTDLEWTTTHRPDDYTAVYSTGTALMVIVSHTVKSLFKITQNKI